MNPQEQNSPAVIDNELFQMYAHYQLCRVKNISNSSDAAEKKALVQILEACQHINASTFHSLANDLLKHSVQLESFHEGGLTSLFDSTVYNPNGIPSIGSPLDNIPQVNVHAGTKRAKKDSGRLRNLSRDVMKAPHATTSYGADLNRQYSAEQSSTEDSDNEEPTIITPKRKRTLSMTITDSRQGLSTPNLRSDRQYNLSSSSRRDLDYMSSVPEQTKQELFKRMKKITDSFQIDYSVSQEGKTPVRSFQIHFKERFSGKIIYHQCQTNFIAFQIGQIIDRETRIFSAEVQEENQRLYYTKGFKKTKSDPSLKVLNKYSKTLARLVNEIGVYCLFMPEVLPPTFYKRADEDLLNRVINHMNEKFPHFATIASIDENGNLFIADIGNVGEDAGEMACEDVGKDASDDAKQDVKPEAVQCSTD
ncbi:uncharacterized protein ATC70_006128 [Mucor velutinosus]|uniref:Uncharacterized protein n=1 Tax=Mucor velutinosus TaxID=708070 RepID=A0AAN7DE19_9FUNG|nr:hypothetical protein ATC70_006128 [Mucor velutinosus]